MRLRIRRRGPRDRRSMTPTVGVGVAYTCLLAAAGTWSLAATLPSNILWGRTQLSALRVELNTIAGQNFAFFTRSPEDAQIIAYRLNSDGVTIDSLMVTPQGRAANLVRVIRPEGWADCTGLDHPTCVARASGRPKILLRNDSPVPTVCGQVVFTVETTTKWAYRRLAEDRYVIARIAPASVDCIHGH
jgi:antimicrobial peptide system SdpA family protein